MGLWDPPLVSVRVVSVLQHVLLDSKELVLPKVSKVLCNRERIQLKAYIIPAPRATFLLIPQSPIQWPTVRPARPRIRLVAVPAAQTRPIPSIAPITHDITKQRPCAHIIHIMPVVLTPANSNHRGRQQRHKTQQCPREIAPCIHRSALLSLAFVRPPPVRTALATAAAAENEEARLASEEQAQITQPGKAET